MLDLIVERSARRRAASATRCRPSREPGHRCLHNLNYWQFGDYLGIGAGAHGKLSFPHRVAAPGALARAGDATCAKALAGAPCRNEHEVRARRDLPFEFMLNALRLREGFDAGALRRAHRAAAVGDLPRAAAGRGTRPDRARRDVGAADACAASTSCRDLQALFLPPLDGRREPRVRRMGDASLADQRAARQRQLVVQPAPQRGQRRPVGSVRRVDEPVGVDRRCRAAPAATAAPAGRRAARRRPAARAPARCRGSARRPAASGRRR